MSIYAQEKTDAKSVQDYTPSVLLNKGQTDFKLFNSLYTQTQFYNEDGNKQDAGERSTYFTSILEYNYGVSPRVAIGGEFWFRSVYVGERSSSSTNVLSFSNSSKARTGINLVGMKIKFNPIKKWMRFSFQSGLLISVISDPQSEKLDRPFLDNNRHLWITKLIYDKKISEKLLLFTQLSAWMSIDKNLADENTSLAIPFDLFVSYFLTNKVTIYLQNQIWPSFGNDGLSSYFVQEGLGIKYQLFKGIELEMVYTSFVIGENAGAGQTFNLGLRILH
ncbi:MAG: hypothetical protein COA97_01100 [Flavobacteriales bacterium]|nr:MAG: hypothetical protein COA97_01100 [Flavobacteriales bacterium]